jgi:hypothetical protein
LLLLDGLSVFSLKGVVSSLGGFGSASEIAEEKSEWTKL